MVCFGLGEMGFLSKLFLCWNPLVPSRWRHNPVICGNGFRYCADCLKSLDSENKPIKKEVKVR